MCIYQQNSFNDEIAKKFSQLLLNIPIGKTLKLVNTLEISETPKNTYYQPIKNILRSYFSKGTYGYMETRDFALFTEYALQGVKHR